MLFFRGNRRFFATGALLPLLLCCLFHAHAWAGSSIVPKTQWISDREAKLTLAWLLSLSDAVEHLREADALLRDIRAQSGAANTPDTPGTIDATATHTAVLLKLGRPEEALELANGLLAAAPDNRDWQLLRADAHAALGHYKQCRDIYRGVAQARGDDPDFALRFAERRNLWGAFHSVETHYRDLLRETPDASAARLGLARVLYSQQRYDEALAVLEPLLKQPDEDKQPWRAASLLRAQAFAARKAYARAIETLSHASQQDADFSEARLLLGEILLRDNQPEQAAAMFRTALDGPLSSPLSSPLAYRAHLGLGRALLATGRTTEAAMEFKQAAEDSPQAPLPQLYTLLAQGAPPSGVLENAGQDLSPNTLAAWAEALAGMGEKQAALQCYALALKKDPGHFPARLGQARVLASAGQYSQALALLHEVRQDFPESDTLLLTQARVLAWNKQYEASLGQYSRLRKRNPQDPVPLQEAARTAYWGKQHSLGDAYYAAQYAPPVDDGLLHLEASVPESIASCFTPPRPERFGDVPETPPFAAYEAVQRALPTLDPQTREQAEKALDELAPLYRMQKSAYLEHKSKQLAWNKRFLPAIRSLEDLLEQEPGNQEALFDLAQAQCAKGLCDQATQTYERLLHLDPTHTLAARALQRQRIRSNPALGAYFEFWDEEGYGDLAQMTRAHTELRIEVPLGCRTRVSVGSHGFMERPKQRGTIRRAYGQSLDLSGVLNKTISFSGGVLAKWYDGAPDSTFSGHAGLTFNADDYFLVTFGYRRSEEYANAFALDADIEADRVSAKVQSAVLRRLELGLGYEHAFYTDDNDMRTVEAKAKILLNDHPRMLSFNLDLTHRHTSKENQYIYDGSELVTIVHPYWAPRHYVAASATLEWRQDLSEFFFCGSQAHYYDVQYSMGTDSNNNPYIRAAAAWHWEFLEHWTWDIEAMVHHSDQWKARFGSMGLSYRF